MENFKNVLIVILVIIIGIPVVIWAFKPLLKFILGIISIPIAGILWIIKRIKR
jgi:predicted tellurium resistance membrane protein TerC